MFSSSGAFTSPVSEAKLRCNQNHSRLQTGREPEIAQRALSHGRLVLQQLPLSSKKHLTCVVGDSGEALKHRAVEEFALDREGSRRTEGAEPNSCESFHLHFCPIWSNLCEVHDWRVSCASPGRMAGGSKAYSGGCCFHMAQLCLLHSA